MLFVRLHFGDNFFLEKRNNYANLPKILNAKSSTLMLA